MSSWEMEDRSLNFIFNNFDENNSFHDIVKEAGVQGFTEPDPKIDLSGVDVARKILILIRESGYQFDIEDIANKSFMPAALCLIIICKLKKQCRISHT